MENSPGLWGPLVAAGLRDSIKQAQEGAKLPDSSRPPPHPLTPGIRPKAAAGKAKAALTRRECRWQLGHPQVLTSLPQRPGTCSAHGAGACILCTWLTVCASTHACAKARSRKRTRGDCASSLTRTRLSHGAPSLREKQSSRQICAPPCRTATAPSRARRHGPRGVRCSGRKWVSS